jgi:hypothetical protein
MRTRHAIALLASAALLEPVLGRADVVDISSTTFLNARKDWRDGQTYSLIPVYEMLSLSAHDVKNPLSESLELVLSTWGAANLGDKPWWNGYVNSGSLSADLNLAYVRAGWANRAVVLSLGRMNVVAGVARMVQLDGVSLALRLPAGFGVSAYAGSPVSARFSTRGLPYDANPITGDVAAGGRVSWMLPGVLDLGASVAWVADHGDAARQDVGGDIRITPTRALAIVGFADYSILAEALAEGSASATYQISRAVSVSADYRYTVPALFLSQNSILWVFSDSTRNDVGANVHLALGRWAVDAGYTELLTDSGNGPRVGARATWRPTNHSSVGAELAYLDIPENKYVYGRVFGSLGMKRFTATLDLQDYSFDKPVNGEKNSFLGTLSVGYALGSGWSAAVAGTGGVTPYYSQRFDLLAKLVYNQTYSSREVRQ